MARKSHHCWGLENGGGPIMNVRQLRNFCQALPGANQRLLGEPANILVYSLEQVNFAYFKTSEPERWRFSLKVTPSRFVELTDQPGVKPARYRGRHHWVTIVDVAAFPAGYLRELVEWSHRHAWSKLPPSRRPPIAHE
jgi:predicted DNA-binding protein (MmcQ/YjbR family)